LKRIFLFLFFIAVAGRGFALTNELAGISLNGKVENLRVERFVLSVPGDMQTMEISYIYIYGFLRDGNLGFAEKRNRHNELLERMEFRYDNSGKKIGATEYGYMGVLNRFLAFRYDVSGKLIEKSELDSGGITVSVTRFFYDKNGNLVRRENSSDDTQVSRLVYRYDNRGNLTNEAMLLYDGSIDYRIAYFYDNELNRETNRVFYIANGVLEKWINFTYNEIGKVSFKSTFDAGNNLLSRTAYNYNPSGQLIRETLFSGAARYGETAVYRYSGGRIVEERYLDSRNSLVKSVNRSFNDRGDILSVIIRNYLPASVDWEYRYEYDGRGNLVKNEVYELQGNNRVLIYGKTYKYTYRN